MPKLIVKFLGVLAILLLLVGYSAAQARAARGVPGSQEFAFGAILYAGQPASLEQGLALAGELRPDWLYVPVSWAEIFPAPERSSLGALDRVMAAASQRQIPVVISLHSAPSWAMTPTGPDPALTAQISLFLVKQYPGQVQAIELFPRANTAQGWGSRPDPAAYLNLFRAVRQALQNENISVILAAGGLQPLPASPSAEDMNDLAFLQGLYDAGAQEWVQVLSLQFVELTGEPLTAPADGEYRVLRHYEQVRQVMVANRHLNGLLWITHLNLPSGQVNPGDAVYQDASKQADWLKRAYVQLRSQLYIGAAFLVSLNPSDPPQGAASLIQADGTRHPFSTTLKELVYQNKKTSAMEKPGRPKDGSLNKLRQ